MIGEAGKHSLLSTLKGMVFAAGSGFWFLGGGGLNGSQGHTKPSVGPLSPARARSDTL